MKHIEIQIQKNSVMWFRLQYPNISRLLFAVPNGGARNRREAAIMKGEGVTAGVADVILLYPSSGFHSLSIEFKTEKGKQQPSQKERQELVEKYGNKYVICRSFDEFRNTIKQ
jgi:hypothetical protein